MKYHNLSFFQVQVINLSDEESAHDDDPPEKKVVKKEVRVPALS